MKVGLLFKLVKWTRAVRIFFNMKEKIIDWLLALLVILILFFGKLFHIMEVNN